MLPFQGNIELWLTYIQGFHPWLRYTFPSGNNSFNFRVKNDTSLIDW
jgi:hypothetical protein